MLASVIPNLGDAADYGELPPFDANKALGAEFERIGWSIFTVGKLCIASKDGRTIAFSRSDTSFTGLLAARVLKDKRLSNQFFLRNGLNVAEQYAFRASDIDKAAKVVQRLGKVVIKPADGNIGRGVTVGVTTKTLKQAWRVAVRETKSEILVESLFDNAIEARYLVIDGKCASVVRRIPPHLRGDGVLTVLDLLIARNAQRLRNPSLANRPILLDEHRVNVLASQGFLLDVVPKAGDLVVIDTKAGLSTGGEPMEISDQAHPEMKRVAERVSKCLPGMDVIGVDILAHDHSAAPSADNYIIIEANTCPDLGGHMYPAYGNAVNVCRMIAEACVRKAGEALGPELTG